jgi:hypothetical protein
MYHGGAGSVSSTIICKGQTTASGSTVDTLVWSGPSWSTTSSTNVAGVDPRCCGGSASSIFACGGSYNSSVSSDTVEKWDGSSWALTTPLLVVNRGLWASGTTSSCILSGGSIEFYGNYRILIDTFIWTGTAWSVTTKMNTARCFHGGAGIDTSAIAFSGYSSDGLFFTSTSEIWSLV